MVKNVKSKGVTLIALVITLVVFLIIISITIATLTGDSGIIERAKASKTQTEIDEEYRIVKSATVSAQNADNMGEISRDNLKRYLDEVLDDGVYEIKEEGGNLIVEFKDSKRKYTVLPDGQVIQNETDEDGNIINEDTINFQLSPSDIPRIRNRRKC